MRIRRCIALGMILVFGCLTVAQVKNQKRIGPGLAGPVRFVRIERASFSKKGNDFVEGPRVLAETISLDPQWRKFERTYYNADGSVLKMDVNTFDADGYQTESSGYDGEGNLIHKIVYVYDDRKKLIEYLTYKPDGSLLNRSIAIRPVPGKVTEITNYNGDGSLGSRAVNTFAVAKHGERIDSSVYNGDGSLSEKSVLVGDSTGRIERFEYKADGTLKARFVDTLDSERFLIEGAEYGVDDSIRRKETFDRVFDVQGNWIKETKSEWDAKAGALVPTGITYQVITYY
jgi:hypothetical protein